MTGIIPGDGVPRMGAAVGAALLMSAIVTACQGAHDDGGRNQAVQQSPAPGGESQEGTTPAASNSAAVVPRASRPGLAVRVRLDRLPMGPPPRIEYIDWTAVVDPDGTRIELEKGPLEVSEQEGRTYWAFGRFGSGWLTHTDSFGSILLVHEFDGSRAPSSRTGGSIVATSDDGQRILMGSPPMVLGPGLTDVVEWHGKGFGVADAAGFIDESDIVFSHRGKAFRGHPDGSYEALPGIASAVATSQAKNWVIGYPPGPDRDVAGIFDAETGRQLLRSPDYTLLSVDPTGSWLVGTTGLYPDDQRLPDLVLATSAGRGLVRVSGRGLVWSTPAWEDHRHLLAVATTPDNRQYVVRIDIHGRPERAAGPSSGDHYDNTVLPVPQS